MTDSINQRIKDLAVSETGFVFDPYSGATFSLNASALCLLRGLKEGLGRDELIAQLEESFDVTDADLSRDIDEFLELLRYNGVLPHEGSE
ncbi:MAG: HPr-rel-A system PqqD family peptide chaperone [Deltaproteobacteria bacterium]|jgi:PqqD family protein of HPr-rel-A system